MMIKTIKYNQLTVNMYYYDNTIVSYIYIYMYIYIYIYCFHLIIHNILANSFPDPHIYSLVVILLTIYVPCMMCLFLLPSWFCSLPPPFILFVISSFFISFLLKILAPPPFSNYGCHVNDQCVIFPSFVADIFLLLCFTFWSIKMQSLFKCTWSKNISICFIFTHDHTLVVLVSAFISLSNNSFKYHLQTYVTRVLISFFSVVAFISDLLNFLMLLHLYCLRSWMW